MRTEYVEVRCCCHPEIRLGWVPRPAIVRGEVRFATRATWSLPPWDYSLAPEDHPVRLTKHDVQIITTTIERLGLTFGEVIDAVKSAHLSVEVWRRVPGFVEELP